jgi:hypothetical protein
MSGGGALFASTDGLVGGEQLAARSGAPQMILNLPAMLL